jgi:hypothetical protein
MTKRDECHDAPLLLFIEIPIAIGIAIGIGVGIDFDLGNDALPSLVRNNH